VAEVFEFAEDGAALFVELEDRVQRFGWFTFGGEAGADAVGFVADEIEREHGGMLVGVGGFGLAAGAQLREQDDLADVALAGHQHHEPVDSDAQPSGGRHAVLHGEEEVFVEHLGLFVAGFDGPRLLLEATALVDGVIETFGRIDILVNNAFRPYVFDPEGRKMFWELDWADYQAQIDGALYSTHGLCKAVLPGMKRRTQGAIVNIASDLVARPTIPYHDYTTAKAALVGFSRNLAMELGPFGIRVNCVAPGLVYPTASTRDTREDVKEMIIALEDFETLGEFMEHVSLVMENDDSNVTDKVNLMTLHGAKGLEFDTVFLAGWEEGLFPHPRTLDDSGVAGLEEERRLAYVGLTRARKQAFVTFAANRRIHGQWNSAMPSRFIDELPEDHVDIRSPTGLYGGGQAGGFSDRSGVFDNNRRQRGQWRSRPELVEDVARSSDDTDFQVGQRVFHQKFGYGKINAVDGGKLEIAFEKAGDKKVMASFVDVV